MEISAEEKLTMLRIMLTIRHFEEKARQLYQSAVIRGTIHLSIGEEAVAAGACLSVNQDDYITSTHRGHGHCIAKGVDLKGMMAEILGRRTGCCQGRGGTMHIFDVAHGIMGTNAVVGGAIPVAAGMALGIQQLGLKKVVLCFFGDGACNEGAFHEALNLAAVWKLPVVFVCANNLYGLSTPLHEAFAIDNLAARADAYGMPGVTVDGNNVLDVFACVSECVDRARGGGGPSLIECKTYRWEGHFFGDPCQYRSKQEVAEWKQHCPIKRLKNNLIEEKVLTEISFNEMDSEQSRAVEEATEFAVQSEPPSVEDMMNHLW
jgi:acetoin:2,6-dichlorophenolindophenol oxidoreductase subunit alpha